jgi:hypothetical protein
MAEDLIDNSKLEKNRARFSILMYGVMILSYLFLMASTYSLNSGFNELCKAHCEPDQYRPGWMGSSCSCGKVPTLEYALNRSNATNLTFNLTQFLGNGTPSGSNGGGFGN